MTFIMPGSVYCLTNPAMPELVKIGFVDPDETTKLGTNLKDRVNSLYYGSTGVPLPFELHYAVAVDDPRKVEKLLFETFSIYRENPRREFFRVEAERVVYRLTHI